MTSSTDIFSDRAEDIDKDSLEKLFVETGEADKTIINALLAPGAHLLEGSRGTGKTMLLRVAYERMKSKLLKGVSSILPVFVRFPTYLSTYNPRTVAVQNFNPFLHWVVAKLLDATEKVADEFEMINENASIQRMALIVPKYLQRLEEHYRDESVADMEKNASRLKVETQELEVFGRLDELADNLLEIARQRGATGIAFFLDEAAQNFAEELQPTFFQIMKHLRHEKISVKAAVYPFVTSYGKDFDIGQDAQMLRVDRNYEEDTTDSFYEEFFSKRIVDDITKKYIDKDIKRFIRVAAGGNPRWIIHILSRLASPKEKITSTELIAAAKYFSDETLWPFLENLGHRLRSRRKYIDVAISLTQSFVEDLRSANKDVAKGSEQKPIVYLAISNSKVVPFRVHQAIQLMLYSGILSSRGPKRISSRENGQLYLLHPALAIRENSLYGKEVNLSSSLVVQAYTNPQRERFREYTKNSPRISDSATSIDSQLEYLCSNCGRSMPQDSKFCPYCGTPITDTSPYQELLDLSCDNLELSPRIKSRLIESGLFPTVGHVLSATDDELLEIRYVGTERMRLIRYAAEEVLSG